jgi:hypothetical protein
VRGIRLKYLRKVCILCLIVFLNLSVLCVQYANTRLIRSILQLSPWITFSRGSKSVFFLPSRQESAISLLTLSDEPSQTSIAVFPKIPFSNKFVLWRFIPYSDHSLQFIFSNNIPSIFAFSEWFFLPGVYFFYLPFPPHSLPSHSCWFDHPSNVQQRVQIIKPFIMEFSPFFCSFCCLTSMCVPFSPTLARCQPNQQEDQ